MSLKLRVERLERTVEEGQGSPVLFADDAFMDPQPTEEELDEITRIVRRERLGWMGVWKGSVEASIEAIRRSPAFHDAAVREKKGRR